MEARVGYVREWPHTPLPFGPFGYMDFGRKKVPSEAAGLTRRDRGATDGGLQWRSSSGRPALVGGSATVCS